MVFCDKAAVTVTAAPRGMELDRRRVPPLRHAALGAGSTGSFRVSRHFLGELIVTLRFELDNRITLGYIVNYCISNVRVTWMPLLFSYSMAIPTSSSDGLLSTTVGGVETFRSA